LSAVSVRLERVSEENETPAASLLVRARVDHQTVEPRRKLCVALELPNLRYQFEKDLLRHISGRRLVSLKVVERDGIDSVFVGFKEQTEGFPVSLPTGFDNALVNSLLARHSAPLHPISLSPPHFPKH
jgi:hypothetical protein